MFTPHGRIVGAGLDQYLLEKSRVCMRGDEVNDSLLIWYVCDFNTTMFTFILALIPIRSVNSIFVLFCF